MNDSTNPELTESSIDQSKANTKAKVFRNWLRGFGSILKRHENHLPQIHSKEEEKSEIKTTIELLGVKESKELSPAQIVLFHTTQDTNVDKLRSNGLFAQKEDPNLGINIGYSTFYAGEHHQRRTGQEIPHDRARMDTPNDYALTIWRMNSHTQKDKGSFKDLGFYQPSMQPSSGHALDEYVDAAISGNKGYAWFGDFAKGIIAEGARMVPPEYFLDSVQLDKTNRELIIKNMILAESGLADADQIETSFRKIVDSNEIAHDLTASIEHNLIRNSIMRKIKEIKGKRLLGIEDVQNALLQTMFLRTKINDRLSAMYLDKSTKWLTGVLNEQSIDTQKLLEDYASEIKQFNQDSQGKRPPVKLLDPSQYFNYYGFGPAVAVAREIKQEMRID